MPIFDLRCSNDFCGRIVSDRYFSTVAASEEVQRCTCGYPMEKILENIRISFCAFQPFTTRNILPDGSAVHVRDRAQLRQLMRKHKLRESPFNDDPIGKADPREFLPPADAQQRYRKRREKLAAQVKQMESDQAKELGKRAAYTGMETRRF